MARPLALDLAIIMMSEESEEWGNKSPLALGGSPMFLMIYLPDVDAAFAKALAAGATQVRPVEDQFYGDRAGTLKDPYGHQWTLGTHVEDLSQEEVPAPHGGGVRALEIGLSMEAQQLHRGRLIPAKRSAESVVINF